MCKGAKLKTEFRKVYILPGATSYAHISTVAVPREKNTKVYVILRT
jgi:hypothetical protein